MFFKFFYGFEYGILFMGFEVDVCSVMLIESVNKMEYLPKTLPIVSFSSSRKVVVVPGEVSHP